MRKLSTRFAKGEFLARLTSFDVEAKAKLILKLKNYTEITVMSYHRHFAAD